MRDLYLAQANVYGTHAEIVAHDLFVMNVEGLDEGRLQMKSSTGIATAVNDISTEFFTHTAANGATVFSIGPSMTLQVNNLVTGKRIINDGITIITVLVVGGNAADKITIYPGDSVAIPKTWVNVVVTNVSATSTGSFQVFIN
jgi:hypothetical protein